MSHPPSVCTVAVLVRPTHLVLAANSDERLDRPWDPHAAYWPDRPHTVAGRDRTAHHVARFEATEPAADDDIAAWHTILADRLGDSAEQIDVVPRGGFGTVCASFVSLPATGQPIWLFAAGSPDRADFKPVFCTGDTAAIPAPPPTHTRPHDATTT